MTVRIIDLETSDLDREKAHVIEVAAVDIVLVGSRWEKINSRARYVRLPPGASISPMASAIHHIIDEDVATPGAIDDEDIATFLHDDKVGLFVAHHAEFERFFLDRHLGNAVPWVCTWKCALRAWPDAPSHGNQKLRYWLKLHDPLGVRRHEIVPHRAVSDAIVTGAIFAELTKRAIRGELLAWSAEPALLTVFNFGKHKGERYDAVPPDYLEWIIGQPNMREEVRYSARYWRARLHGGPTP